MELRNVSQIILSHHLPTTGNYYLSSVYHSAIRNFLFIVGIFSSGGRPRNQVGFGGSPLLGSIGTQTSLRFSEAGWGAERREEKKKRGKKVARRHASIWTNGVSSRGGLVRGRMRTTLSHRGRYLSHARSSYMSVIP